MGARPAARMPPDARTPYSGCRTAASSPSAASTLNQRASHAGEAQATTSLDNRTCENGQARACTRLDTKGGAYAPPVAREKIRETRMRMVPGLRVDFWHGCQTYLVVATTTHSGAARSLQSHIILASPTRAMTRRRYAAELFSARHQCASASVGGHCLEVQLGRRQNMKSTPPGRTMLERDGVRACRGVQQSIGSSSSSAWPRATTGGVPKWRPPSALDGC